MARAPRVRCAPIAGAARPLPARKTGALANCARSSMGSGSRSMETVASVYFLRGAAHTQDEQMITPSAHCEGW